MTASSKGIARKKVDIKELVISAMFAALVFVFTAFINIRLPIGGNGGLIHLGNIPLFIAAMIFGKRTGAIAGAIGMALFDLLSGWVIWAPFTFAIVGLMGFVVGLLTEKKEHKYFCYIIAIIAAVIIKIVGYYFAEVILYSNYIVPIASIPGNIIQVSFAGIVTLFLVEPLRKAAIKTGLIER